MGKPAGGKIRWSWGLLASAVILGVALIIASWSNDRSAREAAQALHNGQARVFERAIFGALRNAEREESPDLQATADSLLIDYSTEGLRYIVLIGPDNKRAAAGISVAENDSIGVEELRYRLTTIGSRVRVALFRHPSGSNSADGRPPEQASPADATPAPREDDDHRRRDIRPAGVIFEFEPVAAMRLVERARGLMLFGMAAAIAMLAVAFVSWNMSRRYERALRHMEDQRRLSLLGEMSAVLAHEIRNPLASLKGHAQLLVEKLPPGGLELRKAETVVREATRLEALTSDLLDFVRLGPVKRAPADPTALVQTSIEEVDPDGFELQAGAAPESWLFDADRMRQVMVNLLRNARQSSPAEAPPPVVTLSASAGRLIIEVRDHGAGLPAGDEQHIFDPFFTTRATGTGLGLAVARRIVEHHGGKLSAANHPKGGAVFRVELPERS